MVWWDIIINIKSVYKSLIAGWTVFCVEGSEVQCNDYRPAPGHLAATLVTTIIQTSELSINYVLPLQQRHGGLSRDQAEQWNILEVYPFISILDMELDMSRDK